MNREDKQNFIDEMNGRLKTTKAAFVVDYQGLDVETLNSIRKALKENGAELRVVKNRLLKRASQETDTAVLTDYFTGPCAIAITDDDPVAPAKVLVEKSKEAKNLEIKVGHITGKIIDPDGVKRLAELPGREVLLSQVLSAMQAVPTSFVRVLNGVTLNFLYALKAIEEQKNQESA